MKSWLYCRSCEPCSSGALLILRVVVGGAFMMHGWTKIQNPTGWMGPNAPVPAFLQAAAAVSEFVGGAALILGLLTPVAAFFIACTMVVAIYMTAVKGVPFIAKPGEPSYELAAVFLAVSFVLMCVGPGMFSLDALLFGRARKEPDTVPLKTG